MEMNMAATKTQREVAVRTVLETFEKLGVPELLNDLSVEWKNSFTARMGDAQYKRVLNRNFVFVGQAKIRFSVPLWSLATEEDQLETAIHEACHVVDSFLAKTRPGYVRDGHHGNSWK